MMDYIKKNRGFLLTMVCLVVIIGLLVFTIVKQSSEFGRQEELIEQLKLQDPQLEEELKAARALKKEADGVQKTSEKAKKAADRSLTSLEKEVKKLQESLENEKATNAAAAAALEKLAQVLAQPDVDQAQLLTEMEAALTALGGTMPATGTEGEGTEE